MSVLRAIQRGNRRRRANARRFERRSKVEERGRFSMEALEPRILLSAATVDGADIDDLKTGIGQWYTDYAAHISASSDVGFEPNLADLVSSQAGLLANLEALKGTTGLDTSHLEQAIDGPGGGRLILIPG